MDDFRNYCKNRIKYGFFRFIFLLIFACIIFYLSSVLHLFSSPVYALETETIYATMSSNGTLSDSGKYKNISSNGTISTNSVGTTYQGKSYGMNFYFEETLVNTQVYNLKITFMADDLLPRVNTSYIGIRTYNSNGGNQEDATIVSIVKNTTSGNATTLQINFIPLSASAKVNVILGSENGPVQITGETTFGIRKVEIGNSSAEGTEQIITNNNQNTQIIITNQDNNTQDIINNQNENTQQQIESQKVCTIYNADNIVINNSLLNSNGDVLTGSSYSSWGVTDYININNSDVDVTGYSYSTSSNSCFYNENKGLISCVNNQNISNSSIPTNAFYIRLSILKSSSIPRLKVCKNGNQGITDSIGELTDALTDDSPVDMSSLGNTTGWLPPGPIDSIINMPLNLMNNLLTALNKTCNPLSIPLPYVNTNMTIPCLNTIFSQIDGVTNYWAWVGTICSVLILYNYFLALYKYYDDLTTLKANFMTDFGGAP